MCGNQNHNVVIVQQQQVRSLAMDSWPTPLLNFMKASGNAMNRRVGRCVGFLVTEKEVKLPPPRITITNHCHHQHPNDHSMVTEKVWERKYDPANTKGVTTLMLRPNGPGDVERKKQW